jgi:hypothetical protein
MKPTFGSTSQLDPPKDRGALSRVNENRVADEVEAQAQPSSLTVKVKRHCIHDLRLQAAQILPLRTEAAASGRVLGGREYS